MKRKAYLSPNHVALVIHSYSLVAAKNIKKIAYELRQRGAKKVSIWDPEGRLEK